MADKKGKKHTPRKERLAKVEALIEKDTYTTEEACELLPKLSISNFTGTASLNVILQLKQKHANESIRGSVIFPNQFGEEKKIVVLATPKGQEVAKKAGADHVGLEDLVKKIEGSWTEFDVVIAEPAVMPQIAKLGKILGPRQMMPNPKNTTVTDDLESAVKAFKSGKSNFKMDEGKSIKLSFGKLDMDAMKLAENLETALKAIRSEVKQYGVNVIKEILIYPSMGPSINIEKE
jgi:large subunit ribosomal protein L1